MCGIVGLWKKNERITQSEIELMRDTMIHRGPDGAGCYIDTVNNVGFGHRRLSIIDLSDAGVQPMMNNKEDIIVVFNGEIYNYRALRQESESWGYKFNSATDTEVIIALYERYGIDCLQHFRGMFSFALWDVKQQRLLLARDRLGIKPLYIYNDGSAFAFSSELRGFQPLNFFNKKIDVSALFDFFSYQYIPSPKSIFCHVRKLMAGHYAVFSTITRQLTVAPYWKLPESQNELQLSTPQIIDRVDELIKDAVRSHLVSDVPVGAFLSGGMDSSTIVTMASKYKSNLTTFTVNFNSKNKIDEGNNARELADFLHLHHNILTLKGNDFEHFTDRFAEIYDEPFSDTSGIPIYEICGAAARSVKVALSGDGGDEIFGGYVQNYMPLLDHSRRYSWIAGMAQKIMHTLPTKFGSSILYNQLSLQQRIIESTLLLRWGQKRMIFNRDVLRQSNINPRRYNDAWRFSDFQDVDDVNYVRKRIEMDVLAWLPEKMLTKVDRASMAQSLEVRVPLLDHKLVEFIFQLPSLYQWHPTRGGKWVLREVLSNYVPASVINRPKQGFSVPLNEWRQQVGSRWFDRVRESRIVRDGVFSWPGIKMADTRSVLVQWMIVNVAVWSDKYSWSV
ncbi:MAG: asparagine synthase (glutamine-hydrolyzing) [Chlorobi bacterium]|nr:asparagine synthase (glutamine-hydrolyzing) [Chlorobiota bacterium]